MEEKALDLSKTVYQLCTLDPQVMNILVKLGFSDIVKPGMLETAGRFMTIPKGAALKKIEMDRIRKEFADNGYRIKE
jgi:hypothetical protein